MSFLTRFERWDPIDEMLTLRNRMDRLWSHVNQDEAPLANWSPTADIVETKDEILIRAELPGLMEKDVDIELENAVLTIKGERTAEKEVDEKGYRRIEREYGTFLRTFTLPTNVETEKIAATFVNGLLEVHLPKKEGAKPKTIRIDVNKQLPKAA
jgi:HSP20 family protein